MDNNYLKSKKAYFERERQVGLKLIKIYREEIKVQPKVYAVKYLRDLIMAYSEKQIEEINPFLCYCEEENFLSLDNKINIFENTTGVSLLKGALTKNQDYFDLAYKCNENILVLLERYFNRTKNESEEKIKKKLYKRIDMYRKYVGIEKLLSEMQEVLLRYFDKEYVKNDTFNEPLFFTLSAEKKVGNSILMDDICIEADDVFQKILLLDLIEKYAEESQKSGNANFTKLKKDFIDLASLTTSEFSRAFIEEMEKHPKIKELYEDIFYKLVKKGKENLSGNEKKYLIEVAEKLSWKTDKFLKND